MIRHGFYLCSQIIQLMEDVVKSVRLRLTVNSYGEVFIWPVAIPSLNRPMPCHVTVGAAAALRESPPDPGHSVRQSLR